MRTHPITHKRSFHNGVDVGASTGTPLYASAPGVVVQSALTSKGGNQILIDYKPIGYRFGYAHLHRRNVRKGQRVSAGQVIGTVGSTGQSTGPHLHFTTRRLGHSKTIEPTAVLRALGRAYGTAAAGTSPALAIAAAVPLVVLLAYAVLRR